MRALVISGGGSKGAFGGGVAQYLIEELGYNYQLFVGTSTGSLLVPNLALNHIEKIKNVYTSVNQESIFSNMPFIIKKNKWGGKEIGINHFNVLMNFLRKKKTFGESKNLRKLIEKTFTEADFNTLKQSDKDVIVTVSNLSINQVEYKSLKDFEYQDYLDWIWISCNYTPFMSLVKKEGCEYADGGFGSMVPIEEAINRGATTVDVIILETEVTYYNRLPSRNVFSLISTMHEYMSDRIEKQNIRIGKFVAGNSNAILNFYYTPTVLTTNSLVFDKHEMSKWWESGFQFAKMKNSELNEIKGPEA
ncbi:patatin-like phospholipase family protein [Aureisphaera sp. CAU 1614]|uniref:Patatin-like phospholipase family protein n=1 Tax=Halomarinibacterium sedimenti TaxID=2857106 RepID=A0A9X1FNE4_9FLAO|nr:patatin-like phospholipase family protein [Halomarinibacterium sedimenti]MAL59218.1 patatin [Flavobacteriaceae bacterium]MBW2937657.1 patatin-like phospholipase family protein [Halomarinibacterium sedimenti]|tara:strand:+ start:220401 stop:221315 length:915 start_codon:yes stop_codon:yes gene_type:complete